MVRPGATLDTAYGIYTYTYNTAAATITTVYGVDSYIRNLVAEGVIDSFMAFYCDSGFNNGTLNNWYGLYVDTPPSATNQWAIYVNGNTKSQLGPTTFTADVPAPESSCSRCSCCRTWRQSRVDQYA
jgi:hypothetical protein